MDAVRSAATAKAAEALAAMPQSAGSITAFLESHYTFGSLAEAEAAFAEAVATGAPNAAVNAALALCKTSLANSLGGLLALKRWIQLNVPKVEDGNNFGVGIQLDTVKMLSEKMKELKAYLDELHKYPSERSGLLDKVCASSSQTRTASTSHSESKGGEKDEAKDASSSSTEEKTTTPAPSADAVAAVAALDARWYYHAHYVLTDLAGIQYVVCDVVEKNKDKIEQPKGSGHSGFSF